MSYQCKYFSLFELLPADIYEHCVSNGVNAWEIFDNRLLISIDQIRDKFGRMTINDWKWGGNRNWSGLRTPDSPLYSATSQHTFGRAADCIFADHSAEDVRRFILKNKNLFPYIRAIEMDVSWLHLDVRNCTGDIKQFGS